jgi:hypothetical protein
LQLPDADLLCYVSPFRVTNSSRKHLLLTNDLVTQAYKGERRLRSYELYCYLHTEFDEGNMVLIDDAFVVQYPQVAPELA